MKRKGKKRSKKPKVEDEEIDEYVPSESESLDEEDNELLTSAYKRKSGEEEEILKVYSSSDDSDDVDDDDKDNEEVRNIDAMSEEDVENSEDSDSDGNVEDGLPDSKAWGSDRKQYYHTDYVDKDYLGFDDESAALQEEKEASAIQTRLMNELEGVDFSLGLFDEIEKVKLKDKEKPLIEEKIEEVELDLSKLSSREILDILDRESPDFLPIINDCKDRVKYLIKLNNFLNMIDNEVITPCKATEAIQLLYNITLQYATNVLFLMHLKEGGERTNSHPVMKRIKEFKYILKELKPVVDKLEPQIEWILDKVNKGEAVEFEKTDITETNTEPEPKNRKERRKRKLELLKKAEEKENEIKMKEKKLMLLDDARLEQFYNDVEDENEDHEAEPSSGGEESEEELEEKRSVPFQILKNKGLTPRRKKENRNPRVKHRNKYKKALKRRRGAVRQPRKELDKYSGEFSGIKKNLAKSIKLS